MTSNNTKPTKPGCWWANVYGKECVIEVFNYKGEIAVFFPGNEVETCVEDEAIEWISPVISRDAENQLRHDSNQLEIIKHNISEAERICGISYQFWGSDWHSKMATEVLSLRHRVAELEAKP
jgi:hypothetical protein